METCSPARKFSLTCQRCGTTGAPVRVESQTQTIIVLSIKCGTCAHEWTVEGNLPVFLTWLKPDHRRQASAHRIVEPVPRSALTTSKPH